MRAQKRRMPAERGRHAKRLGHVQQGSGPAFPVISPADSSQAKPTATTSSQKDTTTPSALPTSSLAKESSASPSPSASQPSPASSTTPLTSSVPSLTNGQSSTATMPISSLIPQGSTSSTPVTSTSSTPLSATTPFTNAATAKSSGLSSGAIVGIIAGAAVVGVALIVFFVRKTALRRRERKRISWSGAPGVAGGVFTEPKFPELSEKPAAVASGPQRSSPVSPFEPHGQSVYTTPAPPVVRMQTTNIPTYAPPAPPPATFNNPTHVGLYPTPSVVPAFAPGNSTARAAGSTPVNATPPGRRQQAHVEATVKCTFVPSLPDELSITAGERIRVVARYDDGWALCANGRGEQGMVPQECLDAPTMAEWGNGRRLSSLNADGGTF